ncbi:MAG: GAF domain-containing protein, partial [Candidatus Nitrotoga sp.]
MEQSTSLLHRLDELNAIGIALSSERDINRLLEIILIAAKRITNSDAGTLYLVDPTRQVLNFEIVHNDTLGIALGGTTGGAITFPSIQLRDATGKPNHHMVVAYAALNGKTINIPDAYAAEGYDFSGTRAFDHKTGYRSTSFLTVPMMNHENETIGVLQLINGRGHENPEFHQPEIHWSEITHPQISRLANVSSKGAQEQNKVEREVVSFSWADQHLVESLASQAAIALT